ncbi:MAG: hypothetical protein CG438_656 [Methylococcaceae bacterium NSP1-1]|nr:MAG: hypothetical protein CG438_656 [Methylococcaceae bacterium NSP1-1]
MNTDKLNYNKRNHSAPSKQWNADGADDYDEHR